MTTDTDRLLSLAQRMTTPERQPEPGEVWKCGDQFLPFHPQASHIPPDYRDGWNRCYFMALARDERIRQDEREKCINLCKAEANGLLIEGQGCHDARYMHMADGAEMAAAAIRSSGTSKSEETNQPGE